MDFLVKMERMLNVTQSPQTFTSTRSFTGNTLPGGADFPENEHRCGTLANFEVKILFRQNASWQGSVTWLEEEREEHFRSVLELAILMDSALTASCGARTTA